MAGEANEKNGGNKKLLIIAVVVIVILLCVVGAMAALLIGNNKTAETTPKSENKVIISAEDAKEVVEQAAAEEKSSVHIPQSYAISQNDVWTFSKDTQETSNANVVNDESNETPVYFDLIVDETDEVIYSSPILELGAGLDGFKLEKPLEAGEYVCTIIYHLVDEEQNELTTVNVGVTVIVE